MAGCRGATRARQVLRHTLVLRVAGGREGGAPLLPRGAKLANVCYFYGRGRGLPGPAACRLIILCIRHRGKEEQWQTRQGLCQEAEGAITRPILRIASATTMERALPAPNVGVHKYAKVVASGVSQMPVAGLCGLRSTDADKMNSVSPNSRRDAPRRTRARGLFVTRGEQRIME